MCKGPGVGKAGHVGAAERGTWLGAHDWSAKTTGEREGAEGGEVGGAHRPQ